MPFMFLWEDTTLKFNLEERDEDCYITTGVIEEKIYLVFIRRFYKEFISLSHYFEVPLNKNDVARDFFDECIYPKKF